MHYGMFMLQYMLKYAKVSNTVKPVLMTTFLKQPPVLNNHFVVLP